jgi:hypothetical protein
MGPYRDSHAVPRRSRSRALIVAGSARCSTPSRCFRCSKGGDADAVPIFAMALLIGAALADLLVAVLDATSLDGEATTALGVRHRPADRSRSISQGEDPRSFYGRVHRQPVSRPYWRCKMRRSRTRSLPRFRLCWLELCLVRHFGPNVATTLRHPLTVNGVLLFVSVMIFRFP